MIRDRKRQLRKKFGLGFLSLFLFLTFNANQLFSNPTHPAINVAASVLGTSSMTISWTPVDPDPTNVADLFTLSLEQMQYEIFSTTGSSYVDGGEGGGSPMLHYTSGRLSPRLSSSAVSYTLENLSGPNTGFTMVVISTICNNCIGASLIPQFSSVSLAVTQYTQPNQPTSFQLVSLTTTPDLINGISTITVSWNANGNPPYTEYILVLGAGVDGMSFVNVGSSSTVLNTATFQYGIANATFGVTLAARNGSVDSSSNPATRITAAATVEVSSMSWLAVPRWSTNDVFLSSVALRIVDNGNDHHDNSIAGDGLGDDEYDHGVFYEVTYATHPFDVAWSTHPQSPIYSTGTAYGGQTGISTATLTNLTSNSTYFFRVRAFNQKKNLYSEFYPTLSTTSFITLAAVPEVVGLSVNITSFTVQLSSNGNSPGTMFSISTSPAFEAHIASRGFTSNGLIATTLSLTNLSTNTVYSLFTISTNAAGTYSSTVTIRASTYTLAVAPPTPGGATATGFVSAILSISSAATNPISTQYAILATLPDNIESVHHGKYLPAISGGVSDLDNISNTPVGQTFSEWNNGSNIALRNIAGGSNYNIHVMAINGDGIPTSTSPPVALATFPSGPRVRNKEGLPSQSWINHLTTTFTVSNSVHYHSTFTRNSGDSSTLDAISNFANFSSSNAYITHLSSHVVVVTATASGPWYFTSFGDSFGYSNDTSHSRLAVNQFQINVDTTPSSIASVGAQFSQTDSEVIRSSVTTGRQSPYFQWTFSRTDESLESPATGYSIRYSTRNGTTITDVETVDDVIDTTSTAVFFPSASRSDGSYYFGVKAKDTAGNWGPVSTFTFVYAAQPSSPTFTAIQLSPATASDGRFLAVPISTVARGSFDQIMKVNSTTSTNNVLLTGIADNSGDTQSESTAVGLTYSTTTRILSVTPSSNLNSGWLYRLVVTTSAQNSSGMGLAVNSLLSNTTMYFQTVMDRTVQNIVRATDGTRMTIPAGAIPSGSNISVSPPVSVTAQTLSAPNTKLRELVGNFAQPVVIREFVAYNTAGQRFTSNFNSPVTIVIPYTDADNDGFVDGVSPQVREKALAIYLLDETNNVWQKVSNATIDTSANTATFQANHFSYYAIFGAPDNDVNGAYAYPVPFKYGSGHRNITFTNLPTDGSIRIYTAVGELVREIKFSITSGASTYVWDVKDEDGNDLGSDVYLYVIESGPNKKKGKVVVIR